MKRECYANILATISSTKGTEGNVKQGVENLVILRVLEIANYWEWVAPSLVKTKPKWNQVHFLSEFKNLNKQLNQKQYPM